MIVDYTSAGDFLLKVTPADNMDMQALMVERGLDYSRPDSQNGHSVFYSKEPWGLADLWQHGTEAAKRELAPIGSRIALSQAPSSGAHFKVPYGKELWPFQKASLEYCLSRTQSLIADSPGLGKTPQAIVYANEIGAKRVLVICPAALRHQWARRIREWSTMDGKYLVYPVVNAKNGIHPSAEWTVISFALARNPSLVAALGRLNYDLCIIDECFPAGTMVETEHGPMPIERIVEGRLPVRVWSHGEKGLVLKAVTRYVKTSSERLVRVRHSEGEFVCTANHRIWTEEGYVAAENLEAGTKLRVVRRNVSAYSDRQERGRVVEVLQPFVFSEMAQPQPSVLRAPTGEDARGVLAGQQRQTEAVGQREDEAPQFRPGVSRQTGRYLQVAERQVVDWPERRERFPDEAADKSVRSPRMAGEPDGVGYPDRASQGAVSEPAEVLQGGFGLPIFQDGNRSGWDVAQDKEVEVSGRAQDCRLRGAWVESVEVYEQAGGRGTAVYNLEVEGNHNYFANGVLVGNCHNLKDPDSSQTRAVFGNASGEYNWKRGKDPLPSIVSRCAHVLCLSGTPIVNRPLEAYTTSRALCWDAIDYLSLDRFRERFNPQKQIMFAGGKRFTDEKIGRVKELGNRMRGMFMARHAKRDVMTQLKMPKYEVIQMEETGEVKKALQAESMLHLDIETLATTNDYQVLGHIATVRKEMGVAIAPQAADYIALCLDGGEDKIVVFGHHIEVLDVLQAKLQKYGVLRIDGSTSPKRRQEYVDTFIRDPHMKVMLGNLQSMGTGVDGLQEVATHCVLVEPSWTPGENQQAVDRLDRGGQQGHVQADFIVAPGSIAEKILVSALTKAQIINKVVG